MFSIYRPLVLIMAGMLVTSNVLQPTPSAAQEPQQPQQRHVLDAAEMEEALARSAAAEANDREAIRGLLRDQRVQQIATSLGLEVKTADAAVSALEGAELAQLASSARVAEAALAGGQSITLTYGIIIIILLVVILLLLVA